MIIYILLKLSSHFWESINNFYHFMTTMRTANSCQYYHFFLKKETYIYVRYLKIIFHLLSMILFYQNLFCKYSYQFLLL